MRIELNHIVEFISLFVAIWNYKFLKGTIYVYFIYYLAFILYAELGASYLKYALKSANNMHIYLWVSIAIVSFKSYFLYQVIRNHFFKKSIIVCSSLLVIYFLFLFFFSLHYVESLWYTLAIVSFYLTLLCCVYFFESFMYIDDEISNAVWQTPDFWVVAGIFIFFTGTSLSFVMHSILSSPSIRVFGLPLYNFIPQVLSVFLYGCFTTAFILCRKRKAI